MISIFMGINVFGMLLLGWLHWAPETSKKFVLSRNVLALVL
jgi:hypothetical protein